MAYLSSMAFLPTFADYAAPGSLCERHRSPPALNEGSACEVIFENKRPPSESRGLSVEILIYGFLGNTHSVTTASRGRWSSQTDWLSVLHWLCVRHVGFLPVSTHFIGAQFIRIENRSFDQLLSTCRKSSECEGAAALALAASPADCRIQESTEPGYRLQPTEPRGTSRRRRLGLPEGVGGCAKSRGPVLLANR